MFHPTTIYLPSRTANQRPRQSPHPFSYNMKKIICPQCGENAVVYYEKTVNYGVNKDPVLFCTNCDEDVTEIITDLWIDQKSKEIEENNNVVEA